MAEQLQKAAEKVKNKNSQAADENKTELEVQIQKLSKIANASQEVKRTQIVSGAKNKAEREVGIEQSQIKMGEIQMDALESKGLDGAVNVDALIAGVQATIDAKQETVSDLQAKVASLALNQGKKLNAAIAELEENNKPLADTEKSESLPEQEPAKSNDGETLKAVGSSNNRIAPLGS